jgi:hypothetical protein
VNVDTTTTRMLQFHRPLLRRVGVGLLIRTLGNVLRG